MWFKNLALFRFTQPFEWSPEAVESLLGERRFHPCGRADAASLGWVPPLGEEQFPLVHAANGFVLITAQKETKILPAQVVHEEVAERAAEIEAAQGRSVGKRERGELRDQVVQELLPRAFSHSQRTFGYIDPKGGWLVVDSASGKKTDEFTALLRSSLGSLPIAFPSTEERPAAVMTRWLAEQTPPADLAIESDCELRDPDKDGGVVRCRRQDLTAPEIQQHIQAGKEVVQLALTWSEKLSFVLDDRLNVKRLRFLDMIQEQASASEASDEVERFDADYSLMTLELAAFLPRLLELFGGEASPRR